MFEDKRCANHPSAEALSFCHNCRKFFCEHCLTEAGDYYFCSAPDCVADSQREVVRKEHAVRAAFEVGFCDACIAATIPVRAGHSITVNGIGTTFYGSREACSTCGSAVRSRWLCIFFIPIARLGRYRVKYISPSRYLSREIPEKA